MKNIIFNVTFVGITVVFLSLIILSFLVYLYPKIIVMFSNKKAKTSKLKKKPTVIATEEKSLSSKSESSDNQDNEELIAVLTAAIVASIGLDYSSKIKVKSYKRVNSKSPVWNTSGRYESLN